MALKTYVGPYYEGIEVVIMGESYGRITPGESIVVPNEVADKVDWPEEIWQDGKEAKAEKKGSDD